MQSAGCTSTRLSNRTSRCNECFAGGRQSRGIERAKIRYEIAPDLSHWGVEIVGLLQRTLGLGVQALRHIVQDVRGLVHPAALLAGDRPHFAERLPEPKRAIGDRNLRRPIVTPNSGERTIGCRRMQGAGIPRERREAPNPNYLPGADEGSSDLAPARSSPASQQSGDGGLPGEKIAPDLQLPDLGSPSAPPRPPAPCCRAQTARPHASPAPASSC